MQGKYWVFTNFELDINYESWGCVYIVYGKEICPETKRIHHQGYCEFKTNQRINKLKLLCKSIHWELRKSTSDEAYEYCIKDGDYIELGTRKICKPGKRTDIDIVRNLINEGKGMKDICNEANSYQALKCGELLLKYKEIKRTWKPTITWIYGSSGSGKSKYAFEQCEQFEYWCSGKDLRWFDGYDAHEYVIFDDYRRGHCSFTDLIKLLDRYPYRVECKGGSRQFLAKHIFITCIWHPEQLYINNNSINNDEPIEQLLRRIDFIINMDELNSNTCTRSVVGARNTRAPDERET